MLHEGGTRDQNRVRSPWLLMEGAALIHYYDG